MKTIFKQTVTTRIPENESMSNNGGDYYEGWTLRKMISRKGKVMWVINGWTSCDMVCSEHRKITHHEAKQILISAFGRSGKKLYYDGKGEWEGVNL